MRKPVFQIRSQQGHYRLLDVQLDEPEFLIALIAHDFTKERHVVVALREAPDSIDNSPGPLDYERFEPVALVQERVHELLHRFSREVSFFAFLVILLLLLVYLRYHFFQLFQ